MLSLATINRMKHSPVQNYGGIPGLTSYLIGAHCAHGLVRVLECSRDHFEPIVPHSHRFDFECQVLAGSVRNIIWMRDNVGDEYAATALHYKGTPGKYQKVEAGTARWSFQEYSYTAGDTYSMQAHQVHSIFFSRGAVVLFFEGPDVAETSIMLQPVVDGETVPTFKVEPWMFKKGGAE